MAKKKNAIAFDFVLDNLYTLNPRVKPMFGCHAIYIGEKIMLILRNKPTHLDANGIWIATDKEHHVSLKIDIPTLHSIDILSNGKGETNWQMINALDDNFETYANSICEFILRADVRIGKIPINKKRKK